MSSKKSNIKHKEGTQYKIKPRQYAQAKRLGVEIRVALDKLKKVDVFSPDTYDKRRKKWIKGKRLASIGGLYDDGTPYGDYASYLLKPNMPKSGTKVNPEVQKKNYLARHSLEPKTSVDKDGKTIKTPSYYADEILWS